MGLFFHSWWLKGQSYLKNWNISAADSAIGASKIRRAVGETAAQ
jgi:hypothetical protein